LSLQPWPKTTASWAAIPAEFTGDISSFAPAETCRGEFREVVDVTVHGFKARMRFELFYSKRPRK
jgi:hypothetical protein